MNSVKQRVPRLLPSLDERQPDVVCLQEKKLVDEAFPALLGDDLAQRGYEVALSGEVQWNGVAILSKAGLEDVVAAGPADALVCGDMNIAPADADVFDPSAYAGHTHVTEPERAALASLRQTPQEAPPSPRTRECCGRF